MKSSPLEQTFVLMWSQVCHGPHLQRERTLVPGRRFRCDFVHEPSKTVIEIEGCGGRHQTITGFLKDAEKYLEITLQGYLIIRLTRPQITVPTITRIVEFLKGRP